MKRFITAIFCMLAAVACEKPEQAQVEEQLRVSFSNVSGVWDLSEWKGSAVEPGTVVVKLNRDKTFTLSQTVGSMYPAEYTGEYNLVEEEGRGTAIRGIYDYTYEYWEHRYIVTSLTESKMEWTSEDDAEDIYVYSRID